MGKTYKEAKKGSKQSEYADEYKTKKKVKHSKMQPYSRTKE